MRFRRLPVLSPLAAVIAISLLAAGCGGGGAPGVASVSSSTAPGAARSHTATSQSQALLVAGRCLRHHGLAHLPDPSIATVGPAKGQPILDKQALLSFPKTLVSRAMSACHTALAKAGIGNGPNASQRTPQEIQDGLAFARCVRRHGITNFPDPNGQGQFDLSGTGINPHALTPTQLAAARACLSAAHGAVHIPTQATAGGNSGR